MNLFRLMMLLVLLSLTSAAETPATSSSPAQIRFTYENPKLQPAKYVILVKEDGSGHYHSEPGDAVLSDKEQLPAIPQDREIQISKSTREEMFSAARQSKYFALTCESGGHNMAFQGKKTLEYRGPDGQGSCMYNWSKLKQIDGLTNIFEGISLTLEEGSKLQVEYAHSRLALDPEMEFLDQMAQEGRALELNNIAPILRTIAGDDATLKRVQRRAHALLLMADSQ